MVVVISIIMAWLSSLYGSDIIFLLPIVITIDFNTTDVVVNEDDGTAEVCLQRDKDTEEPFTVQLTASERVATGEAKGGLIVA